MREIFIYYRLEARNAAPAEAVVTGFQASLRARFPGLATRLLRRPEAADGVQTWMETYAADPLQHPDGVSAAMEETIEQAAEPLRQWLVGPRHAESFIAVDRPGPR